MISAYKKRLLLGSSPIVLLRLMPPLTSDSYRNVMTAAAVHLGVGSA